MGNKDQNRPNNKTTNDSARLRPHYWVNRSLVGLITFQLGRVVVDSV